MLVRILVRSQHCEDFGQGLSKLGHHPVELLGVVDLAAWIPEIDLLLVLLALLGYELFLQWGMV